MKQSFSDSLTPGQIQQVLDELRLPWRDYYNSGGDGWVNIPHHALSYDYFNSGLSVNVNHGGFIDCFLRDDPSPTMDGYPIRGDIVTLVTWLRHESFEAQKGIAYIKEVCGIHKGQRPPDVLSDYQFANRWLGKEGSKFVRIPKEILGSKLSGNEKIVWAAIFSHCNGDEIYAWPGTREISKNSGLSRPTVLKALNKLKDIGLILEKNRGPNKPPLRFPLITSKEQINKAILAPLAKIINQGGKDP